MNKFLSMFMALMIMLSFVGVQFADAKSYSSGRSSFKSSSYKSSTSKPKASTTKPEVSKSKKSITTKKITKPKSKVIKTTVTKPKVKPKTKWANSHYYSGGSFVPYLMTAGGAYLIYKGLEDDGDPIYIDSKTGEEIDDDDLDSLGAKQVNTIPDSADSNDLGAGFIFLMIILGLIAISLIVLVLVLIFN